MSHQNIMQTFTKHFVTNEANRQGNLGVAVFDDVAHNSETTVLEEMSTECISGKSRCLIPC